MSNETTIRPELPESWYYPNSVIAEARLAELKKEMSPKHLLYGKSVEVFATCRANDDVLFRHLDETEHFTVVHLTGIGKQETNPKFPSVVFDGTLDGFIAKEKKFSEAA